MVCSKETTPHRVIRLFVTGELDSSHLLCLTFDVVYACSYPEAVKRRPTIVAFHRLEGHLIAVLNAFVAVGVLTATSRADWFWCCYYSCTHITPVAAKREAPKHCSGLITVVEPGCLLDQVCWYLILRGWVQFTISRCDILPEEVLVILADESDTSWLRLTRLPACAVGFWTREVEEMSVSTAGYWQERGRPGSGDQGVRGAISSLLPYTGISITTLNSPPAIKSR